MSCQPTSITAAASWQVSVFPIHPEKGLTFLKCDFIQASRGSKREPTWPTPHRPTVHGLLHKFQNFHTETNPPSKFSHLLLSHKTALQKASGQRREHRLNSDSVPHNNLASWQGSFNPGGQRAYSPYNAANLAHSSATCTSTPLHLCFAHYKASHLSVLIFLWILSSFLNWNSMFKYWKSSL